jgi:hypothetical protein
VPERRAGAIRGGKQQAARLAAPHDEAMLRGRVVEVSGRVVGVSNGSAVCLCGALLHRRIGNGTRGLRPMTTMLNAVNRNGKWAVRMVWANGAIRYFGKFKSEGEAVTWIAEHRWMTAPTISERDIAQHSDCFGDRRQRG